MMLLKIGFVWYQYSYTNVQKLMFRRCIFSNSYIFSLSVLLYLVYVSCKEYVIGTFLYRQTIFDFQQKYLFHSHLIIHITVSNILLFVLFSPPEPYYFFLTFLSTFGLSIFIIPFPSFIYLLIVHFLPILLEDTLDITTNILNLLKTNVYQFFYHISDALYLRTL